MFLRQFDYLIALAREGHFARAADACNVTQPTLSAGLGKLERELGFPVIERDRRFVGLTAQGEIVLKWARQVVADLDGMRQELAGFDGRLTGRLRVGVIPTALPSAAVLTSAFGVVHPAVAVQVLSLTSVGIQQRLDRFELDVGLTYLDNEPLRNVRRLPLYVERYVFVAREDRGIGGSPISWEHAAEYPLCLLTADMQNRRILDQIFAEVGAAPVPRVEINSLDGVIAQVRTGECCTIIPSSYWRALGAIDGLQVIPLVLPSPLQSVGLVVRERDLVPPVTAAFLQCAAGVDFGDAAARSG